MSKRRGLPTESHMQHDSHFVDSLSERFGAVDRAHDPDRGDRDESGPAAPERRRPRRSYACPIESKGVLEPLLVRPTARRALPDHRGGAPLPRGARGGPRRGALHRARRSRQRGHGDRADREPPPARPAPLRGGDGLLLARARRTATRSSRSPTTIGKSRVSITEAMSLLEIPEKLREKCRRADIDARSVLLEIARLGDERKMGEAIALVASGSTRDDLREQKKAEPGREVEGEGVSLRLQPKDGAIQDRHLVPEIPRPERRAHRRAAPDAPPARVGRACAQTQVAGIAGVRNPSLRSRVSVSRPSSSARASRPGHPEPVPRPHRISSWPNRGSETSPTTIVPGSARTVFASRRGVRVEPPVKARHASTCLRSSPGRSS